MKIVITAFVALGLLMFNLLSLSTSHLTGVKAAPAQQVTAPPWVRTPRPTSTPRPSATNMPVLVTAPPGEVAGLALSARNDWPAHAYAVVQWQDGWSRWNDVENWRGPLHNNAFYPVVWGVYARDFGTGPFRWVIYEREGGAVWGVSAAFDLPAQTGQVLVVPLTLVSR